VWTADEARAVLEEWRRSGDTITLFARRHGVSTQRLSWWRKRFAATVAPTALALVPATLRTTGPAPAGIVIRLPNGIALDIETTSPSWIAMMVGELARTLP
jgi:hypothetical protein